MSAIFRNLQSLWSEQALSIHLCAWFDWRETHPPSQRTEQVADSKTRTEGADTALPRESLAALFADQGTHFTEQITFLGSEYVAIMSGLHDFRSNLAKDKPIGGDALREPKLGVDFVDG